MARSRKITGLRALEGKTVARVDTTGTVSIVFTDGTGMWFENDVFIDTVYTYDPETLKVVEGKAAARTTDLRALEGKTVARVDAADVFIVFTDGTGVSSEHDVFIDTIYTYDANPNA